MNHDNFFDLQEVEMPLKKEYETPQEWVFDEECGRHYGIQGAYTELFLKELEAHNLPDRVPAVYSAWDTPRDDGRPGGCVVVQSKYGGDVFGIDERQIIGSHLKNRGWKQRYWVWTADNGQTYQGTSYTPPQKLIWEMPRNIGDNSPLDQRVLAAVGPDYADAFNQIKITRGLAVVPHPSRMGYDQAQLLNQNLDSLHRAGFRVTTLRGLDGAPHSYEIRAPKAVYQPKDITQAMELLSELHTRDKHPGWIDQGERISPTEIRFDPGSAGRKAAELAPVATQMGCFKVTYLALQQSYVYEFIPGGTLTSA